MHGHATHKLHFEKPHLSPIKISFSSEIKAYSLPRPQRENKLLIQINREERDSYKTKQNKCFCHLVGSQFNRDPKTPSFTPGLQQTIPKLEFLLVCLKVPAFRGPPQTGAICWGLVLSREANHCRWFRWNKNSNLGSCWPWCPGSVLPCSIYFRERRNKAIMPNRLEAHSSTLMLNLFDPYICLSIFLIEHMKEEVHNIENSECQLNIYFSISDFFPSL